MPEHQCEVCCSTGIVCASLVKDEAGNNKSVEVLLCEHFDEATEANLESITATGIPVEIVKERPNSLPTEETDSGEDNNEDDNAD